jgi:hypothetical protein
MVIRKEESFIRTNYMALARLHMKVVALIGESSRMVKRKDMEHMSGLMETDTLGNSWRMFHMGMEYTDGQVELYIKDNINKIKEMVMDITGGQVATSIMDSTRMIRNTEQESS